MFTRPDPDAAALAQLASDGARPALAALLALLPEGCQELPVEQAQALLAQAASQAAVKKGLLMKSLRAALLGSLQGPDLVTTWRLLHRSGEDRPRLQSSSSIP